MSLPTPQHLNPKRETRNMKPGTLDRRAVAARVRKDQPRHQDPQPETRNMKPGSLAHKKTPPPRRTVAAGVREDQPRHQVHAAGVPQARRQLQLRHGKIRLRPSIIYADTKRCVLEKYKFVYVHLLSMLTRNVAF